MAGDLAPREDSGLECFRIKEKFLCGIDGRDKPVMKDGDFIGEAEDFAAVVSNEDSPAVVLEDLDEFQFELPLEVGIERGKRFV